MVGDFYFFRWTFGLPTGYPLFAPIPNDNKKQLDLWDFTMTRPFDLSQTLCMGNRKKWKCFPHKEIKTHL